MSRVYFVRSSQVFAGDRCAHDFIALVKPRKARMRPRLNFRRYPKWQRWRPALRSPYSVQAALLVRLIVHCSSERRVVHCRADTTHTMPLNPLWYAYHVPLCSFGATTFTFFKRCYIGAYYMLRTPSSVETLSKGLESSEGILRAAIDSASYQGQVCAGASRAHIYIHISWSQQSATIYGELV